MSERAPTPLAQAMQARGISDKGLLGVLGRPVNGKEAARVGRWRSGEVCPTLAVQQIIAKKLDTTPELLWPGQQRAAS